MTKIIVKVNSARNLKCEDGILTQTDPYLQLEVGDFFISQKHKTNTHVRIGDKVEFGETFEFNVNENDELKVRLYDDALVKCKSIGEAKIQLKEVFEFRSMEDWYPMGKGSNYNGEVHLNIHTQ